MAKFDKKAKAKDKEEVTTMSDDELLAMLEEEEQEVTSTEEDKLDEVEEDDVEAAAAAIESEEAKEAAYEEQESDGDVVSTTLPPAPVKSVKTARGSKFDTPGDAIVHQLGADAPDQEMIDKINALPKKVGEKAVNLLLAANGRSKKNGESLLSIYTSKVMSQLAEKGEMSSNDIYGFLLDLGYKDGTARAQGQQMFSLLPTFDIAKRDGNTLRWNDESEVAKQLWAA